MFFRLCARVGSLSPRLYALYLEPFCLNVPRNDSIHGFRLHSTEMKVLAYADDAVVFCSDMSSVSRIIQSTKDFCETSGAAVNTKKACAFTYAYWDNVLDVCEGIYWSQEPGTYLGYSFQNHVNMCWTGVTAKLVETSTKWGNHQDLSVSARFQPFQRLYTGQNILRTTNCLLFVFGYSEDALCFCKVCLVMRLRVDAAGQSYSKRQDWWICPYTPLRLTTCFPVFIFTRPGWPFFCVPSFRSSWRDIYLIFLFPLTMMSCRGQ